MAKQHTYRIGEDVMYKGKRFTVSEILEEPYSLRLVATLGPGPEFVQASPDEVEPLLDDDSKEMKTHL